MMPIFILPDKLVKKVINGEIDYGSISCDENNEINKGYKFEDQAIVNLELEKDHSAKCSALEKECLKKSCALFSTENHGKLDKGWVCREYKADFPDAPFDLRFHVSLIGIDKVDALESIKNLEKLKAEGGKYACLKCSTVYAEKPTQNYEDGHGGRKLEMCSCGSDLFDDIDSFISLIKKKYS